MRLKNYTDFTDEKLRQIIDFVRPRGLLTSNFDIKVTNSTHLFAGKFYSKGGIAKHKSALGTNGRPLIITRVIGNENRYPHFTRYGTKSRGIVGKTGNNCSDYRVTKSKVSTGGYIDTLFLSREEAIVHVLAHEFRHFWQMNHRGKRGKVWGARGVFSDRDADYYAIHKTRAWRRLHNQLKEVNWNLVEGATSTNVAARREQLD